MACDDPERWLAHFVGGMWRAPLATRMAVTGTGPHRVVLAGPADMARAIALRRPAPPAADAVYRAILARAAGPMRPDPPTTVARGAIFLAHPADAAQAIALAMQVSQAGLPPGCSALLYTDHR